MKNKPSIDKDLADIDLAWRILDRIEERCMLDYSGLSQIEVLELILNEMRQEHGWRAEEPRKEILNGKHNG